MAWIESHQSLGRHPKLIELAKHLNCGLPQAVGHLHYLWWWSLDYAPDGYLGKFSHEIIAGAALWDETKVSFVDSLLKSGFLDSDFYLHDWHDYAGKLLARKEANARRMKEARNAVCNARVAHVQNTCGATVPYLTLPNINTLTSELPKPGSPNPEIETQDPVKPKPSKPVFDETCEAYQLASHLRDCILAREPTTKVPNDLQRWSMDADRMLRIDNRDYNESRRLIEWCQHDDFWCTNILSMGKFRKHFDQLKRKSQHAQGQKSHERTLEDVLEDLRREGV